MIHTITCVSALHGNEYLPALALVSQRIPQLIGNPLALARGRRCIDEDLNMVFGLEGDSSERKRAVELLGQIGPNTMILDFHTFSCVSEPFAIVVDPAYIPKASKLGLPYVVYMKHSIKSGHALINFRPGISVEVGKHTDPVSFTRTLEVYRYATETRSTKRSEVLEVFDIITEPGNYKNFCEYDGGNESFIPVLAGEQAYTFPGLKARRYNSK